MFSELKPKMPLYVPSLTRIVLKSSNTADGHPELQNAQNAQGDLLRFFTPEAPWADLVLKRRIDVLGFSK